MTMRLMITNDDETKSAQIYITDGGVSQPSMVVAPKQTVDLYLHSTRAASIVELSHAANPQDPPPALAKLEETEQKAPPKRKP